MSAFAVFIAVGTLAKERYYDSDRIQRGINHDCYEDAAAEGLRHLADGHWSTFTIEKRYYRQEPTP